MKSYIKYQYSYYKKCNEKIISDCRELVNFMISDYLNKKSQIPLNGGYDFKNGTLHFDLTIKELERLLSYVFNMINHIEYNFKMMIKKLIIKSFNFDTTYQYLNMYIKKIRNKMGKYRLCIIKEYEVLVNIIEKCLGKINYKKFKVLT